MVLNYIWIAFFVIAFLFAVISLCMGDATVFQKIVDSTFDSSKNAFELSIGRCVTFGYLIGKDVAAL